MIGARRSVHITVIVATFGLLSVFGCRGSGSECIEGESQECRCVDGGTGAQVCRADGTFEECVCTSTGEDAGGADVGESDTSARAETDGEEESDGTEMDTREAGADTSGGGYPNEPGGLSLISERSFSSRDEGNWVDPKSDNDNFAIASDAAAPKSPTGVGRMTFPKGFGSPNQIPGLSRLGGWRADRMVYVAFWLKVSANWHGHQSGTNKIGYVWYKHKGGSFDGMRRPTFFYKLEGIDDAPLHFELVLQHPELQNLSWPQNVANVKTVRGQWHFYEFTIRLGNHGAGNGQVRAWVDGTKVIEYTDQTLRPDSDGYLNFFQFQPIWGGNNVDTVPETQQMWMDHVRISGQ